MHVLAGCHAEIQSLNAQLEEAGKRAAADLKAANERTATAERTIASLQAEIRAIKEATRVKELEEELVNVAAQLAHVTAQRDETAALLEAQAAEIEKNNAEIHVLQEERDQDIEEAVRAERKHITELQIDIDDLKRELMDASLRHAEIVEQKADVESALANARERLGAYERSYGLEDAVKEQEQLREAIRRRDADIARLTSSAAMQMDAYDMLEEIARRLAAKSGYPEDVDIWTIYSDTDLKGTIQATVERLRSANIELMRQNDALESQRTKLLHQLRVHAEQMGEKSLKYYGLTAEQLMLVNEFAENLRDVRVVCETRCMAFRTVAIHHTRNPLFVTAEPRGVACE